MDQGRMADGRGGAAGANRARLETEARPERQLIRHSGSFRHIDFRLKAGPGRAAGEGGRVPLTIGLVLDRSGSMSGQPLAMAKAATLAVVDQLSERDRVAVVTFDDQIDLLQPAQPVTSALRARLRGQLERVEARASTALHEAWLTGCRAIAAETAAEADQALTRCLLLTDGQANVGLADPEQIAGQVAEVRRQAAVGTSTFGFGPHYNEFLLGPMASAGGGQFHHLRTPEEIRRAVVGELGGLLGVVARQVRLEFTIEPGVVPDVVSDFWVAADAADRTRWSVTIGELLHDEPERHIVVRFGFPPQDGQVGRTVRWRVVWMSDGIQETTPWQEVRFRYEGHHSCDAEPRDADVMRWVGVQHAYRARREATVRNQRGDLHGAQEHLRRVARRISEYAGHDPELLAVLEELRQLEQELAAARIPPMAAKEYFAYSQQRSRGQRDRR